jgi:pilus assembly protein Flp/PilA
VQHEYKRNTEVPRAKMKKFTTRFLRENKGVTAIEYALIAALVAVALAGTLTTFETTLAGVFTKIGNTLSPAAQ